MSKTGAYPAGIGFHLLSVLLIGIIGFSVYANALRGQFLWDDRFLVQENPLIAGSGNILKIFSSPLTPGFNDFYRPLINISFLCDYAVWRLNPFGYHLSGVLIHLFNAFLVYWLAFLISSDKRIALGSGLLFAVHTILTEPVNYISSRGDLLVAFFILASLICYITSSASAAKRAALYFLSVLFFICALLSKEMAAVFPVLLLAYEFSLNIDKNNRPRGPGRCVPFALIALVYGVLRFTILKFPGTRLFVPETTIAALPFAQRFFTSIRTIPTFIRLLIAPVGLHKAWLIKPVDSFFEAGVIFSLVLLVLACMLVKTLRKRSAVSVFGILWFFVFLLPHLNIYPLNAFLSEGWLYLPTVGFVLFFSAAAVRLAAPNRKARGAAVLLIFACAAACYSTLTVRRNKIWSGDPVVFYQDILRHNPYEDRIYNVLGNEFYNKGLYGQALEQYRKSLGLNPGNHVTYYNIGTAYYKQGKLEKAAVELKKAVTLAPGYAEAYNNLGLVYHRQGMLQQAILEFEKAVELNRNHVEAYFNLGNVYFQINDLDKAVWHYKKAISLNPNHAPLYNNLGNAYSKQKKLGLAVSAFSRALAINPDYVQAHNDIGSAYFENGDYDKAIGHYEKVIAIDPEYAQAYYNLAVIYYTGNQYEKSRKFLDPAIDLFSGQGNRRMANQAVRLLEKLNQ